LALQRGCIRWLWPALIVWRAPNFIEQSFEELLTHSMSFFLDREMGEEIPLLRAMLD
jgi:hypothetical protein